jgi:hypothetical protein
MGPRESTQRSAVQENLLIRTWGACDRSITTSTAYFTIKYVNGIGLKLASEKYVLGNLVFHSYDIAFTLI